MAQTEALMLVGLGFFLALLLVLAFGRTLWSASNRFAKRQREKDLPADMMSLQADRDRLRTEHAVMAKRLEAINETARAKVAGQTAEVSRHRNRVIDLTEDVNEQTAELTARTDEVKRLNAQLQELAANVETHQKASQDLVADLAEKDAAIKRLEDELDRVRNELTDSRNDLRRVGDALDAVQGENRQLQQEVATAVALSTRTRETRATEIRGETKRETRFAEVANLTEPVVNPFAEPLQPQADPPPPKLVSGTKVSRFDFDRPVKLHDAKLHEVRSQPAAVQSNDISDVLKEARLGLSQAAQETADASVRNQGIISLAKRLRAMQTKTDEKISKTLK